MNADFHPCSTVIRFSFLWFCRVERILNFSSMKPNQMNLAFVILALLTAAASAFGEQVSAKAGVADDWKTFSTRTLSDLPAVATNPADSNLSRFGGLLSRKSKATGFFTRPILPDIGGSLIPTAAFFWTRA